MTVQPDGGVLVGGSFQSINGQFRPGLARFYGAPSQPVVQFVSNQDPNTGLYSADISVNETAGIATITVQRLGDTTGAVAVNYATSNGTATAGLNYVATSGTLAFAPLEASKTISIPILDDHQVRNDLQFQLALSNLEGGGVLGLRRLTVTVQNADLGFLPGGITRQTNRQVSLSLSASGAIHYVVEASTNLTDWVALATNILTLTDSEAPRLNKRFYRARLLP